MFAQSRPDPQPRTGTILPSEWWSLWLSFFYYLSLPYPGAVPSITGQFLVTLLQVGNDHSAWLSLGNVALANWGRAWGSPETMKH